MALTPEEAKELAQLEAEAKVTEGVGNYFNQRIQEPSLGQQFKQAAIQSLPELGGMFGGVAGGLLGLRAGQPIVGGRTGAALGSAAVSSMLGAGFGGATGEAGRQAIMDSPDFGRVAKAGLEQASYDAAGNLIFSAAGKAYRIGKEALTSKFGAEIPDQAIFAADRLLKEEGAFGLTPFQSTKGTMSGISESIARGSFSGKPVMMAAEEKTKKALVSAKNKILDDISTNIYDSVATGESFANAVNAGDEALKNTVRPFYENLSKSTGAVVDMVPLQNKANQLLNEAEKAGGLTLTETETKFLTKLSSAPESLNFATAHDVLSTFKKTQRDLKAGDKPDSALYARMSEFVGSLQNQMDTSFAKTGGKPKALDFEGKLADDASQSLSEQYKLYSNLYKEGVNDLYSETTSKLLRKDPEFVGKNIFAAGSVTAFKDVQQALGRAKQLDPKLNVTDTINSVRRGYVENLLKSENSFANLGDKIKNDEAIRRTFETVLTPPQQSNVRKLLKAAELSSVKPSAEAPLFLASQQAQAVTGLGSLALVTLSPDAQRVASENPYATAFAAGSILLGPRFIAKSITNPEATNAALALLKQQADGIPITKNLLLKTTKIFEKAGITAEDLTQPTSAPKAPVGLTEAEAQELKQLELEVGQ
jgi:hypothetical protein